MTERERHEGGKRPFAEWRQAPIWERIVAFVGLLLLLGLLGFMIREAIWGDESLPDIVLAAEKVQQNGNDYVVSFVARNGGGKTAAAVVIGAKLVRDGKVIEEAEAVLDYLPSHSERRGGLVFVNDPRDGTVQVAARGYADP